MKRIFRATLAVTAFGAGAAFVLVPFPAEADPPLRKVDVSQFVVDAGKKETGSVSRTPPDPPAMSERGQWVYDLRYDRGDPYLVAVRKLDLAAPQATPRAMGRFAVELFEGPTLIERVRFDFPGLAAGEPSSGPRPVSFEKKLRTRIGVMFPATKRGNRLELWDRATERRWTLPWPPAEPPPPAPAVTQSRDGG
jgi:hypothetical protein